MAENSIDEHVEKGKAIPTVIISLDFNVEALRVMTKYLTTDKGRHQISNGMVSYIILLSPDSKPNPPHPNNTKNDWV
jgi:hypothetical protein